PVVANVSEPSDTAPPDRTPRASNPATRVPPPAGSSNLPVPTARVAGGVAAARPETPAKAMPETPPEEPADAGSGGGVLFRGRRPALVLVRSSAAFGRSGRDEGA